MKFFRENRWEILFALGIWNGAGFMVGLMETADARLGNWECHKGVCNRADGAPGVEYKSLAAFTNPGYVLACELHRERFSIKGIGQ